MKWVIFSAEIPKRVKLMGKCFNLPKKLSKKCPQKPREAKQKEEDENQGSLSHSKLKLWHLVPCEIPRRFVDLLLFVKAWSEIVICFLKNNVQKSHKKVNFINVANGQQEIYQR